MASTASASWSRLGFRAVVDDLLRRAAGEPRVWGRAPGGEVELARFFVDAVGGKIDGAPGLESQSASAVGSPRSG